MNNDHGVSATVKPCDCGPHCKLVDIEIESPAGKFLIKCLPEKGISVTCDHGVVNRGESISGTTFSHLTPHELSDMGDTMDMIKSLLGKLKAEMDEEGEGDTSDTADVISDITLEDILKEFGSDE